MRTTPTPAWLIAWVMAALTLAGATAAPVPKSTIVPKPLPAAVVKAWTDAGAEAVWVKASDYVVLEYRTGKTGEAGEVPGFRFPKWREGVIPTLPAPNTAFALDLSGSDVTDAGVGELADLKGLTILDLTGNRQVMNVVVKELTALKALTWLSLDHTDVADAGLAELVPLKNLTRLDLYGTKVTDAGLKELAPLKRLTHLDLTCTRITDTGAKELAALKGLTYLDLYDTMLTDAGATELAALKNLTHLNLTGAKVTDAGAKELAVLTKLTELHLSFTAVTDDGLKWLRKALPDCRITAIRVDR